MIMQVLETQEIEQKALSPLGSASEIRVIKKSSWAFQYEGEKYQVGEITREISESEPVITQRNLDSSCSVIEFIERGSLAIDINGKSFELKQGSFIIYGPSVNIRMRKKGVEDCKKYRICIDHDPLFEIKGLQELLEKQPFYLLNSTPYAPLTKYFNLLLEFSDETKNWQVIRHIIESLIAFVLSEPVVSYVTKEPVNPIVKMLDDLIEGHFKSLKSLDDIEARTGYAKSYLSQVYKKYAKTSLYQRLLRVKLDRACKLLELKDWKIRAISEEVGFVDHLYFSRVFAKKMGMSPSEYRYQYKHS